MARRLLSLTLLLTGTGFVPAVPPQERQPEQKLIETKYPLLARLDFPTDSLPEGCRKPDIKPDDFPIKGLRQCAIITDPQTIAILDEQMTKVGAKNIEALYYGIYREAGELGTIGWAFTNAKMAEEAHQNVTRHKACFRAWHRGRYVVFLWRDTGTTDKCLQQMAALIEEILRRSDKLDH